MRFRVGEGINCMEAREQLAARRPLEYSGAQAVTGAKRGQLQANNTTAMSFLPSCSFCATTYLLSKVITEVSDKVEQVGVKRQRSA